MIFFRHFVAVALLSMLFACEQDAGPGVVIRDVRVLAPMAGSTMGVAYLTIDNHGSDLILIDSARSPQFDAIEIHETVYEDGVSRMRPVDVVEIPPGESVRFETGGRHLMLMGAREGTAPGSPVTIEFTHSGGLLLVSATMQARLPAN
jgi:copper(I)-binding protein